MPPPYSPTDRLQKFKRSTTTVQSQRIDMSALLLIDPQLKERTVEIKSKRDFFHKLETMQSLSNQCSPGSILPSIPSVPSFTGLSSKKTEFNATFRSIGYSAPPCEPFASLSKARYMSNLLIQQHNRKNKNMNKNKKRTTTKKASPPSKKKLMNLRSEQRPTEKISFAQEILKLHQLSVANRSKAKAGNALYDRAIQFERTERKNALIDRRIADADNSVKRVIARSISS